MSALPPEADMLIVAIKAPPALGLNLRQKLDLRYLTTNCRRIQKASTLTTAATMVIERIFVVRSSWSEST